MSWKTDVVSVTRRNLLIAFHCLTFSFIHLNPLRKELGAVVNDWVSRHELGEQLWRWESVIGLIREEGWLEEIICICPSVTPGGTDSQKGGIKGEEADKRKLCSTHRRDYCLKSFEKNGKSEIYITNWDVCFNNVNELVLFYLDTHTSILFKHHFMLEQFFFFCIFRHFCF